MIIAELIVAPSVVVLAGAGALLARVYTLASTVIPTILNVVNAHRLEEHHRCNHCSHRWPRPRSRHRSYLHQEYR
jgi:hypothetical protein